MKQVFSLLTLIFFAGMAYAQERNFKLVKAPTENVSNQRRKAVVIGMEVAGENYLIPIDAELNSQTDVQFNAININQVLGNMDEKRVAMKLLILDACRDNPFKRSWSRDSEGKGLAQMSAPKGTFIAFTAAPGATAADGGNYSLRNGVFTHYLKQEIVKSGVAIEHIFTVVSREVANLTNDMQSPFRNSSLTDVFLLHPAG